MIPEAERDPYLGEKLKVELPGILAWAVRGCVARQRDGLGTPEVVKAATKAYQQEQDTLGAFLGECCVVEPGATATKKDVFARYQKWAGESGEKAVGKIEFGKALKERGAQEDRVTAARSWWGIGLTAEGGP